MKKIYNLMLLMAAVVFASCSDIPSPYELFDQGGTSTSAEPQGIGIYADPFNCVAANAYIENGGDETVDMYVKGIVYSIDIDTSYGNATYYISDDGTSKNKLEIYRGYSKNGDKFKSDDEVKPGDEVIVCGKLVNYNGTFEMTQGSKIVYLNGEVFGHQTVQGDPKGNGTLDDPYNPVGANNFTNSLDDNATSDKDIYIKGVISKVKECSAQYGNATFYITETGSTDESDFYVYRCQGLGNKPIDSDTYVKEGDEVIICGRVTKYVSQYGATAETVQKQAYIYSLNGNVVPGEGGGNTTPDVTPGTPSGNGTIDTPFNVAAAVAKCKEVGETATTDFYYVKGIAETITTTGVETYGNITIDLVDAAGSSEVFKAFQVNSINGEKFTAATAAGIKKGDEIVVKGKLVNYKNNTPETTGKGEGCVVFVNGKTTIEPGSTGDNDNPGGGTALSSLVNGGFEEWVDGAPTGWKSASTASSATLSQNSDAHGGKYSVSVEGATANKRLATSEMTLAAGKYTFSFYAKATTSDKCQCRPGYVPVTDGKVGSYAYGDYATIKTGAWTLVTYTFELATETTVCLVVMNPKGGTEYMDQQAILIDDATLTK